MLVQAIYLSYMHATPTTSMDHLRPPPRMTSQIVPEATPVQDAFLVADDILRQGVVGISEIIIKPGLVNVDFADVRCDVWQLGRHEGAGRKVSIMGVFLYFYFFSRG